MSFCIYYLIKQLKIYMAMDAILYKNVKTRKALEKALNRVKNFILKTGTAIPVEFQLQERFLPIK